MSGHEDLAAELVGAIQGLREILRLVSQGRQAFDASEDRRRSMAFCWVGVGSALKHYARSSGVSQGQPPLSAPIRFRDRLAHQRLDKLDTDLLWDTSVRETPVLVRWLEQDLDRLLSDQM